MVFTSNLGIYTPGPSGERIANVMPDETFETVKRKVRGEIEKHFKSVLNRPEILNRIGENVIVFDFIRPEVADEIFDQMVDALLNDVGSLGYDVSLSKSARATLRGLCLADLSNGGRGIRNQVEAHLINPLSRALFDSGAQTGRRYEVQEIMTGASTTVTLADGPVS
jgi:ATP-dependent Clp protease ATP-binding subunit ClpA